MSNCIIAQSGGPTSVINSSVVGLLEANKTLGSFNKVFAGLNGIEGILNGNIIELSSISQEEINNFKYTPSSGLGSCRYKMKKLEESTEEYDKLLEILKAKKTMTNQEIMDQFHISRDTARRDIVRLVNENLAVRTHGGITLNDVHQIGSYQTRKQENEEIKNEIGKIAVSLSENNKVIFFDTSTTVAALCQYVEGNIEAYTHSLDNIEILSNHCLCQMIGGTYFKKNRYMYGSQTLNMIDQIYFDLAYVAAAAVMEDGIYVEEFEDAMIKKKVASRSQKVCLVVDHSKFNKKSSYKALAFQDIDVLVVDWLPDTYREKIEKAECQIIYTKEK